MGLDMYAFTFDPAKLKDPTAQINLDFIREDGEERRPTTELAYWRKFNHLHGWMEDLYREKGGIKESFNCCTVRLELEDLARLEADLEGGNLEHTPGFFFGGEEIDPQDIEETKAFIEKSRTAISEGLTVFYDSWW